MADVTQPDQTQAYSWSAGADILLANAGIEGELAPITDYSIDVFDRVMAVNVPARWESSAIPVMSRGDGGNRHHLFRRGRQRNAGHVRIRHSKHAVIGLMRTAALEGAPFGIASNRQSGPDRDPHALHRGDGVHGRLGGNR